MNILMMLSQVPGYMWFILGSLIHLTIKLLKPKSFYLPLLSFIPFIIYSFLHDSLFFHASNIDFFYYSMSVLLGAIIGIALQFVIQRIPTTFYKSKYSYLLLIGSFFLACFLGSLKATNFTLFSGFLMGHIFTH